MARIQIEDLDPNARPSEQDLERIRGGNRIIDGTSNTIFVGEGIPLTKESPTKDKNVVLKGQRILQN